MANLKNVMDTENLNVVVILVHNHRIFKAEYIFTGKFYIQQVILGEG